MPTKFYKEKILLIRAGNADAYFNINAEWSRLDNQYQEDEVHGHLRESNANAWL